MSIRLMTKIWDCGQYAAGTLLVLLALADFADDDGNRIFPHVAKLAKKARLSTRATQNALDTLRTDGVLIPVANASGGRGKAVEYRLDIERVQNLHVELKGAVRDDKGCSPRQERVQSETQKGAAHDAHIDNHHEPSREPSREPPLRASAGDGPEPASQTNLFQNQKTNLPALSAKAAKRSDREDLDSAYGAYNEVAARSGWPLCQARTAMRDGHLRKRMHDAGGLDGWNVALSKAEASDFLCGRKVTDRGPFFADIDFLLRESSFVKLMEGRYDNRTSTTGPAQTGTRAAAARVAERLAARGNNNNL